MSTLGHGGHGPNSWPIPNGHVILAKVVTEVVLIIEKGRPSETGRLIESETDHRLAERLEFQRFPAVLYAHETSCPLHRKSNSISVRGHHPLHRRGQQTNSEWINRARLRSQQLIAFVRGRKRRQKADETTEKRTGGSHCGDNTIQKIAAERPIFMIFVAI